MNNYKNFAKPLIGFAAMLLVGLMAACTSGSGSGSDSPTESVAPTVSVTSPANTATAVALNSKVTVTFSEAMDASTINATTITLKQGTTDVTGVVTYAGKTAVFTPAASLTASVIYTATVSIGVKDVAGNALAANKIWTFTTGAVADSVAPTVLSTIPADVSTGFAINAYVSATFDEEMDVTTIDATTFMLKQGTTPVPGAVTYIGKTAFFKSTSNLATGTLYTATVSTGVKDMAGNVLVTDKVWSFTTATVVAHGPAPVLLGTSANYAILAKTAVSTVPASVITGDVGVSPAATSFLTGFSLTMVGTTAATSTQVTGSLYGADMTAPTSTYLTTAVSDMETAYTDAAGRPTPDFLNLGSGEIGGQTLAPGLYKWTTGVTISTNVTISGAADDVWIFQIPGDLLVNSNQLVTLGGTAKAKNIFWQVAGTVTVMSGAHFEGIALSQTSITLGTGATMNGRALAQTAVDLDQSTVTNPAN